MNSASEILAQLSLPKEPEKAGKTAPNQAKAAFTSAENPGKPDLGMAHNCAKKEEAMFEGPPQDRGARAAPQQSPNAPPAQGKQDPRLQRAIAGVPDLAYDENGFPVLDTERKMAMVASRLIAGGFVGRQLDTPAKVINAMGVCAAAGLPWQTWINKTYFIDNKIAVYVEFQLASAQASGDLEYCRIAYLEEEGNEKTRQNMANFELFAVSATVKHRRSSLPQEVIWDKNDVVRSQKGNSATYKNFPGDMMMWRALSRALRPLFPASSGGALIQGIHDDMEPVRDEKGAQVHTQNGQPVYRSKKREQLQAVFAAKDGEGGDGV